MKTKILITLTLILTCFFSNSFSQSKGDIIVLTADVKVVGKPTSTISNNQYMNDNATVLEKGIQFVVGEKGEKTVELRAIDFIPLQKNKKNNLTSGNVKDKSILYNYKTYTISRNDFNDYAELKEEENLISVGILTLPFKARPQEEFSYDLEFNLNSTLNWTFSRRKVDWNLQLGAGIGSIGLTEDNSSITSPQDVGILTMFGGLMIEHKKVQAGLYAGFDYINNQSSYNWDSHSKIWLGFTVGYDLFKVKLVENKPKNKQ